MTTIDQARIDAYAEVSGDHNPLHVDPGYAAQTRFGTTIVHGHLLVGLIARAAEIRCGERWAHHGRLDVTFTAPVRSGDDAQVRLDDAGTVTVSVDDRVCVVGTATVVESGHR